MFVSLTLCTHCSYAITTPMSYGYHHTVFCTHFELWFESCFHLMYVLESTTACCEVGVEDVVKTTVANDLQVITAWLLQYRHYIIPRCTAVNCSCRTISCGYCHHSFYHQYRHYIISHPLCLPTWCYLIFSINLTAKHENIGYSVTLTLCEEE